MPQDTVRAAATIDTWTSFVLASLGALGLALLAVGPLVPSPESFQYLPQYAFVSGGLLVVLAAMMRLRSMLIVLGCLALTAGLACTLVGGGDPDLNLAALALYCAAGLVFGAAGSHLWMAVPFALVPLLIVAPGGPEWAQSREAFSVAWETAVGGPYLLAGLPAGLAIVGAAIRQLRVGKWVPVRPSAVPLLMLSGGLLMASLIVGSLLPAQFAFAQTVCMRIALIAGVLGWVGLSYQVGRTAFVWEAALVCLCILAGALFLDRATQFPDAFGLTLGITVAASLVPAALAVVGLLARRWIGRERPAPVATPELKRRTETEERAFRTAALTAHEAPSPPAGPQAAPANPTQTAPEAPEPEGAQPETPPEQPAPPPPESPEPSKPPAP